MPSRQNELQLTELPVQAHTLTLEDRRTLVATGVARVISCDETGASLETTQGNLTIGGQQIQVGELSVRTGEVRITGKIEFLQYSENKQTSGGFLRRLFG